MRKLAKDPNWLWHEGYPRDRDEGDEPSQPHEHGLYVVTMENMVGVWDVGHHVRLFRGKVQACDSTNTYCIGTVGRIDQKTRTVMIRLNEHGRRSLT